MYQGAIFLGLGQIS